jgi:guanylate kinase
MGEKSINVSTYGSSYRDELVSFYSASDRLVMRIPSAPTEVTMVLSEGASVYDMMIDLKKAIDQDVNAFKDTHPDSTDLVKEYLADVRGDFFDAMSMEELQKRAAVEIGETVLHFTDFLKAKIIELAHDITEQQQKIVDEKVKEVQHTLRAALKNPDLLKRST